MAGRMWRIRKAWSESGYLDKRSSSLGLLDIVVCGLVWRKGGEICQSGDGNEFTMFGLDFRRVLNTEDG